MPEDEYLNTSYRPEVEFVDGMLVERGMLTPAHGALQRSLRNTCESTGMTSAMA